MTKKFSVLVGANIDHGNALGVDYFLGKREVIINNTRLIRKYIETIGSFEEGLGSEYARGKRYLRKILDISGSTVKDLHLVYKLTINQVLKIDSEVIEDLGTDCFKISKTDTVKLIIYLNEKFTYYRRAMVDRGIDVGALNNTLFSVNWIFRYMSDTLHSEARNNFLGNANKANECLKKLGEENE